MTWAWEYDPSEEYVIGGAPPALVADIEKAADELVRAAAAFYLDGSTFEGFHRKALPWRYPTGSSSTR
jgi:hypothetical protein